MQLDFSQELGRAAALVDAMLAAETLPAGVEPEYLRQAVPDYPARGGKRLRAALIRWCCAAVGGDPESAAPAMLAVELYHNWTLVHDDIIDGDETRRGRPACQVLLATAGRERLGLEPEAAAAFGRHQAMLAGDIQHGWAVAALLRTPQPAVALALAAKLCGELTPALISGEALDVEFACRAAVPAAEIEHMNRLKTGALLEFAATAGAMIGLGTVDTGAPQVQTLASFAADCGLAFQLQDDILGVFGDQARLGKPIGADLREKKQTMLIAKALELIPADRRGPLLAAWGNRGLDAAGLAAARREIEACGALGLTMDRIRELAAAAHAALDAGLPPGPWRRLLHDWADFVTQRDH